MRFTRELLVSTSRAEIERRLFAMTEWMGYRMTAQLPGYTFERGFAGSALISFSPQTWHSTLRVALQEMDRGTRVCLEQKVTTSGQIKSRLDRLLYENELDDLVRWLDRLEPPEIDRKRQNVQAMGFSVAYTAILLAIPLGLYFTLGGISGIMAGIVSGGVLLAIWPRVPFRPTPYPLSRPGPIAPSPLQPITD